MKSRAAVCIVRNTLVALVLGATAMAAQDREEERLEFVTPAGATLGQRVEGPARNGAGPKAPYVVVVAPRREVGRTVKDRPAVWWYLSKPTERPIEVTVNDKTQKANVVTHHVKVPAAAGFHKLDLAEVGQQDGKPVALQPGNDYEVVVTVVMSEKNAAEDVVASARIERVERELPSLAKAKKPVQIARTYGQAGLWFDYLDALRAGMAKDESDKTLELAWRKALIKEKILLGEEGPPGDDGPRAAGVPAADE